MEWPTRSISVPRMLGTWLIDVWHRLTDQIRDPGHSNHFR